MKKVCCLGIIALAVIPIMLLTGCTKKNQSKELKTSNNAISSSLDNKNHTDILGNLGHGLANIGTDEHGKCLPLIYEGGEMNVDYKVHASGSAKTVGFLVFINGIPQPYKLNKSNTTYEYMHIFEAKDDDKDTPFTLIFMPITGKKGDALNMTITSIYNPTFIPDMKNSFSYAICHSILPVIIPVVFHQDTENTDTSLLPHFSYIQDVKQSTTPITSKILDKLNSSLETPITMESLNKNVYVKQYFGNRKEILDNLQVDKDGKLHITFQIVGVPGARYKNTFYINHKAMTDKNNQTSFETVLSKDNISMIELDIDLSQLEEFNTFYAISMPCNTDEFSDVEINIQKTPSILLYK